MASHSRLSPSKAHRYLQCPGSVVLEGDDTEDDGNEYTAEGTAAHELAALCLQEEKNAEAYEGRIFVVEAGGERYEFEVNAEMIRNVQAYVDYVRGLAESLTGETQLLVEHRVDLSHVLGPDEGGTADAIVLDPEGVIDTVDLKYGKGVRVSSVDNPQALLYTLGALKEAGFPVKKARVHIAQPRLDNWSVSTYTIEQLEQFAQDAARGAKRVEAARDAAGSLDKISREEWEKEYLHPSSEACKFCKAKSTCPALAKESLATVSGRKRGEISDSDFEDFTAPSMDHVLVLGNEDLAVLRAKTDMISDWVKAVEAEVQARLVRRVPVPGWKVVKGKRAAPQWASPDKAEELLKSFRLKKEQMYSYSLISPSAARKIVTEPRRVKKLEPLIRETGGLPTVVPDSDPRPSLYPPLTQEDDFEDLTG